MNSERPQRTARNEAGPSGNRNPWASWLGGVLLAAVVTVAAVMLWPGPTASDAPALATTNALAPGDTRTPGFGRLAGKWLRPDGGYVLDLRMISSEGRIECGYFNPNPIHVARAEATRDGTAIKVFVELQDVNYPGCTYTLKYEPDQEALTGVYYQAALKESYDVRFVRLPQEPR